MVKYEDSESPVIIERSVGNPEESVVPYLKKLNAKVQLLSKEIEIMQKTLDLMKTGKVLIVQDSLQAIWDNKEDDVWNNF